jgi:hypothetical protein
MVTVGMENERGGGKNEHSGGGGRRITSSRPAWATW